MIDKDFYDGDEIISIDKVMELMTIKNKEGEIRIIPYHAPDKYELKNKAVSEMIRRYYQKLHERTQDERGPFVMAKTEANRQLEKNGEITITYRRYFMIMLLFANFDSKPFTRNGLTMGNKEFAEMWGISEGNAKKALSKYCKWELIFREKDKVDGRKSIYKLNPVYFLKGEAKNHDDRFVKIFQRQLRNVYENIQELEKQKNRNPKVKRKVDYKDVIGLLHAVLPYFHFETYYLVKNADEQITLDDESVTDALNRNPKILKHLSKSHIGRILGHKNADRATLDNHFEILEKAGALMVMKSSGKTRYLIHPDLMFRLDSSGNDEYTKFVRTQFKQHGQNNSGE